jgi:hypothetical protein
LLQFLPSLNFSSVGHAIQGVEEELGHEGGCHVG